MSTIQQWNIQAFGVVQGVFLRSMVKSQARNLKLHGTVRNLPDGSIAIKIQGKQALLGTFEQWLWSNPGSSNVERVEKQVVRPEKFADFQIRY